MVLSAFVVNSILQIKYLASGIKPHTHNHKFESDKFYCLTL